jgi:hypothetical protein
LAFLSKIINCVTNIFDRKQLKYSPKVCIFALRRENGTVTQEEMSGYFWSASTNCLPVYGHQKMLTNEYKPMQGLCSEVFAIFNQTPAYLQNASGQ